MNPRESINRARRLIAIERAYNRIGLETYTILRKMLDAYEVTL